MTPDRNLTAALLSARERREEASEAPRRYLGASVIGHPCDRFLWMHFRGIHRERFDGRMLRLFDRGQREEAVFIQELRWIGAEVMDRDPSTGAQWAVEAYGGHIRGHLDAAALLDGEWHVCEFKTHNDKSFKDLVRKGVRDAKPMHYAQMQLYMGLTGMRHALYLAVDKNDDTLHAERVDFDETLFETLMRRARAVIDGTARDRVSDRADDWRCKACPASALCFPGPDAAVFPCDDPPDCRSCRHASADTDRPGANWTCALGLPMTIGAPTECRAHQPWPDAMPGVEIIDEDAASGTLRIRLAGAQEIAEIGPEPGQFSGPELAKLPRAALRAANAAKAAFAGAEVKQTRGLIDNWTLDGWGVEVWKGDPSGVAAALASFGVDPARILASDEAHHIQAWQYRGAEAVEYLAMLDPRRNRARILKARF